MATEFIQVSANNEPASNREPPPAAPAFEELIVTAAACGILVYDSAGQCRQANEAAAEITGGTIPQLLQQNFRQIKSWQEAGLRRMAEEVLASGIPQRGDFHALTTFGRPIWISCRFHRFEKKGEPHLLLIANNDAPRRQVEEMAARHAVIVESSDDAIISKTLEGIITTWNPGAQKIFGFTAREAIGQPMEIIIPPDRRDEEDEILGRIRRKERIQQFETVRVRKDGTQIYISATISPILNQAGELIGIANIARDMTEHKSLEAQFRQAQKMDAVGRLAGGVAHDFNNLLTIILGYCDFLLQETPAGQPTRDYVVEIKKAGERASALTRQLLAYSRKQILVPDVVNLNEVVKDCDKLLKRLLGEDVELESLPATDLGLAKVDANQLEQALINLAINARDAMPRGGKLTIKTVNALLDERYVHRHPEAKAGPHVILTVSDTGCGMSEDIQSHLFEPFFTTKEPGKGTGLGLAMVFGFVKQSGGHITVQSEPGRGSTFQIYFPAVETAEPGAVPLATGAGELHGSETILVVEDEPALRKLARQILVQHGYTVLEAGDVREALWLAETHPTPIHLLLSDVVMPLMGGRELGEQIAVLRPGIKILFTSGYTDDTVMRHGIRASETAFIQKPFTVESLPFKVRKVLAQ